MDLNNPESLSQLLISSPEQDTHLQTNLLRLFDLLQVRHDQRDLGNEGDDIIIYLRRAVGCIPRGGPIFVVLLGYVGLCLHLRFTRNGVDGDLEEALIYNRWAIQLTPAGRSNLPVRLNHLGTSLQTRFKRFGIETNLEEALSCYRQAINLTPDGHKGLPARLHNLGTALQARFKHFGAIADLEGSITIIRRAIILTPVGRSDLPRHFSVLSISLRSRFDRFGEDNDLEEAITGYRRAIKLTSGIHAEFPSLLNNLTSSLESRFHRFGEDADLDEAITSILSAIELTPEGHNDLPRYLNNLAALLESRFHHLADKTDLDRAITNHLRAVMLTPHGDYNLPSRLNNLGVSLCTHITRFGDNAKLDEAIGYFRQAISLRSQDHADLPRWLNNLANSLRLRFNRFGMDADLSAAITNYRDVVRLTPGSHYNLSFFLKNLAGSLQLRFQRFGDDEDLEQAITLYRSGSTLTIGSIKVKYDCATSLALLAHANNRLSVAMEGYTTAISLMSQVAWFGQSVASRQRALSFQPANFASDAAACAISLGLSAKAVELLDHGRSVFWSQATDFEADLTELRDSDPDLAAKFEKVARALEAGTFHDSMTRSSSGEHPSSESEIAQRPLLTKELESLLERIRNLPKLHNFMKPPLFSELQLAAAAGPVVLLNASRYRRDALIVTIDPPPQLVPLSDMSMTRASSLAVDFRSNTGDRNFRSCLERNLPVIWSTIVHPVLVALGYIATPSNTVPKRRIWWCPTGPFSFIPIHAAGPYTKSGGPDLTKRVLSSYTPALRALIRARSQLRKSNDCRMLLISQPATPGQPPLPGASEEIAVIQATARSKHISGMSILDGSNALIGAIVEKLKDTTCAHFACHGHQNQSGDALQSALFLHDGPLLLSTIASNRLPKADFAFLSACSTASGLHRLPDEAMHIAAGMLVAGFRSVIATMWSIGDRTGPIVTEKVYGHLLRDGGEGFDSTEAAFALDEGVQSLRKEKFTSTDWVPFIHIGI